MESALLGYGSVGIYIYYIEYIYPKARVKFSRKREDELSWGRRKARP